MKKKTMMMMIDNRGGRLKPLRNLSGKSSDITVTNCRRMI
jgi:hypothetical protein